MRCMVLAAAVLAVLSAGPVKAGDAPNDKATIRGCITAAAKVHRIPPAVLVILLDVEGGSLGRVSPNTNGTVDIGPIQVNEIWLPEVAAHWHATIADVYKALRDNFCANVEAGAWILRRCLDEARGDFWDGVGYYHSHIPEPMSARPGSSPSPFSSPGRVACSASSEGGGSVPTTSGSSEAPVIGLFSGLPSCGRFCST
jgi:hypothetical protein